MFMKKKLIIAKSAIALVDAASHRPSTLARLIFCKAIRLGFVRRDFSEKGQAVPHLVRRIQKADRYNGPEDIQLSNSQRDVGHRKYGSRAIGLRGRLSPSLF